MKLFGAPASISMSCLAHNQLISKSK
jgi:hypothetical protein